MITPEELEIMIWNKTLPDRLRLEIHELTRTVRTTDAELEALLYEHPDGFALNALNDLRDRYEGLGKYATAQPPHPSPRR